MFSMNREAAASITCTSTALTFAFVLGHPRASEELPQRCQPQHQPAGMARGRRGCWPGCGRSRLNLVKGMIWVYLGTVLGR